MAEPANTPVVRHPVAATGIALTTLSALLFVFLWAIESLGWVRNPYLGLFAFITAPALFVLGLLLIPVGAWLAARRRRRGLTGSPWPTLDFSHARVRRIALLVLLLTAANVLIVGAAGFQAVHWMESPSFCGQVCHTPMEPHFVQWGSAAHARVACVSCHVGSGGGAFVRSKINGMRQLAGVVTGSYERPIPTPVRNMRPPEFTCSACHSPAQIAPDRRRIIREYADDEASSVTETVLRMKVGPGTQPSDRGIHWHADPAVEIEYVSDPARETIPWVRLKDRDGRVREFRAEDAPSGPVTGERRRMDCLDCHNRAAHSFAFSPERVTDGEIAAGRLDRALPYVRRETVKALRADDDAKPAALEAVARALDTFYRDQYPDVARTRRPEIDRAMAAARAAYDRAIFPSMKVTWGTYPNQLGHVDTPGCFRCHDDLHKAADGSLIRQDCEMCHTEEDAAPAAP